MVFPTNHHTVSSTNQRDVDVYQENKDTESTTHKVTCSTNKILSQESLSPPVAPIDTSEMNCLNYLKAMPLELMQEIFNRLPTDRLIDLVQGIWKGPICREAPELFVPEIIVILSKRDTPLKRLGISKNKLIPFLGKYGDLLSHLDLSDYYTRDKFVIKLSEYLTNNKSILSLRFGMGNITNKGAIAIAQALEKNTTLQELDLSYNCAIKHKGAEAIAEALAQNEALESLDLSVNDISDEGIQAMVSPLKKNTKLQSLDLSCLLGIDNQGPNVLSEARKK